MNPAIEHPCNDDSQTGTDERSNDKNLELFQFDVLSSVEP